MAVTVVQAVTAERVSTLKTYRASELSTSELLALTARPRIDFSSIMDTVCLSAILFVHDYCWQAYWMAAIALYDHACMRMAGAGEADCGGCEGAGG